MVEAKQEEEERRIGARKREEEEAGGSSARRPTLPNEFLYSSQTRNHATLLRQK